jgi:molybdopterin-biosynthesis enzyme MoeA-like protein
MIGQSRPDAVIIATGGLGPTRDDMTKSAASAFFNSRLIPTIMAKVAQTGVVEK